MSMKARALLLELVQRVSPAFWTEVQTQAPIGLADDRAPELRI